MRKLLPQMTLDEYQSTRWVCKAILCDQYKDCSVCPSWKNSNKEFEEEKYFSQYRYKIQLFAGIGK